MRTSLPAASGSEAGAPEAAPAATSASAAEIDGLRERQVV